MEVYILLITALIQNTASFKFVEEADSVHTCEVGDVVQNGRITCTCTQDYIYNCIYKKTSKQVHFKSDEKMTCEPKKIYSHDTTTCICNHNGSWPHSACGEVFNSLPLENVVKNKCEPDGYIFVGCNVCRCDSEGYIDKSRCTNNDCHKLDSSDRRSFSKPSKVYGNCEAKNWYSLAPCQFCFCLNENKLLCNTGNYVNKKLQLGSYNLSVCGKDLIREAIELIPDDDKTLRHGNRPLSNFITSKPTLERPTVVAKNNNIQIDVALENKQSSEVREDDQKSNEGREYSQEKRVRPSSESREENVDYEVEERLVESTQIPFQDDYPSKEIKEPARVKKTYKEHETIDKDDDTDNENEVIDSGLKIPEKSVKAEFKIPDNLQALKHLEALGMEQLKLNLPVMLNKVFRMALRKSMVTIDGDSNCVPGAVNTVKCNTCFCMKNSKLLCTTKVCE